jgi:fibronectin type 3 domain-containing protein
MALAVMFLALFITGCGGGGGGSDSPPPSAPPAPPETVSAAPGIGEVTLNWSDVTGATSYNVYRSQISPVTKTGTKTTVTDNAVVVAGLDNGIKYYFVVTAVDANGESAVSVEVSATPVLPPGPTGVAAAPGDNTATINWTSVAGATSYNVYRSQTSPVTKTTGTKSTGTDNSLVITGLTNGTPYYFVVTVVVNGLESPESSEVTATPTSAIPPAPGAPINVTGAAGAGAVTITWPAVATATSYNAYYSTSPSVTIATGTKVTGATSGSSIPNLVRGIPYYFVVTALNAGGESGVSNEVTATPNPPNPVFSQADLAGTWNVRVLRSGASSGWYLSTISVDNTTGNVSVLGTSGPLTPPAVSALSITAGTGVSGGVVTETGASSNPTFHGKMSSGKTLIVGTSTQGTSFDLHVFVKRVPGVTFGSADLASKTFKYHRIYSGSSQIWEIGTGSTNASGLITFSSQEDKNGPIDPVSPATTLSVDGTGIVTIVAEPTFTGVMSPDKKIIVGTSTDAAGKFSLRILQVRGQSYTQADLAGEYVAYSYHSDSTSSWARATWNTNISGTVNVTNIVNSDGSPGSVDDFDQIIDGQGNVPLNGILSFGKDLFVSIKTYLDGSSMTMIVQ